MMHGHEKSDPAIVAVKPVNKAEQPAAEQSAAELTAAEPVEPRAGTKGNAGQQTMPWAQSQTSMPNALERIRKVARERKKEKFISLFHHISVELLEEAFYESDAPHSWERSSAAARCTKFRRESFMFKCARRRVGAP
jgi:RNA-directed DNA polymerase